MNADESFLSAFIREAAWRRSVFIRDTLTHQPVNHGPPDAGYRVVSQDPHFSLPECSFMVVPGWNFPEKPRQHEEGNEAPPKEAV